MEFIDYYKILGLDKRATAAEIKKAYRKLARKHHPDLNPNDKEAEAQFKRVNEANEVLSNVENRKKYDQHGKDWKNADQYGQARSKPGADPFAGARGQQGGGSYADSDFSDFFESMFGGAQGRSYRSSNVKFRGEDLQAQLQLDLMDVYTAEKRTITVNGKNLRITIPAGVEQGQTIRIKNHGGAGANGGPNGDLLITFAINNATGLRREGANLYKEVDVPLYTAVLGGDMIVDTLDGKVKLQVKPGMESGTSVKLKGKGFPVYKKTGSFGDLYLNYKVVMPQDLSDKEKGLFEELRTLSTKKS